MGDEISHTFWKRFRKEIKAVKPDALIVGEIWHFAGDFLEGDEWDSVMNYQFYHSVHDLLVTEDLNASSFLGNLDFMKGNLNTRLEGFLWNLIDSHDTARFLHSVGYDLRKQKLAAALQLLLPGMPMIYYGDEVALGGGPDPDCRRGMLWDENRQNRELLDYYRTLLRVRRNYPALTKGVLVKQYTDDSTGLIYMERKLAEQNVILLFHIRKGTVELPELKGMRNLIGNQSFEGRLGDYEAAVF